MRGRALALVFLALVAAGCSDDKTSSGGDSSSTASNAALPTTTQLQDYFTAVATYDVSGLQQAAQDVAADGSAAQAYALYQADIAQALTQAGQQPTTFEATPKGDGFQACGKDTSACATWSDLEGKGGRLSDFSVNGTDVADSLVDLTGTAAVDVAGLASVTPQYAYRSPLQDTLYVTVEVDATSAPVEARPARASYIEQQTFLKGASTSVAGTVAAGGTGLVTLEFDDAGKAALDGQVTLPLSVGGKPQSVGFGLKP